MIHRQLGRTGLSVSQLGFGAMRLPSEGQGENERVIRERAIPMIHRAFELGVNYIDTAVGYNNRDSQVVVGEALKAWTGQRIIVSTKNPNYGEDEKEWRQNLEDSLERLQIDCIDIYNHHGLNWKNYTEHVEPRVGKWIERAHAEGLIRHICCSFHDTNDALVKIVETDRYDVITLQYNLLDRQLEPGIALAAERHIGVIAMGPVGGGRLGVDSAVLAQLVPGAERIPELALRFVLANPHVSIALSGMSEMAHVEENCAIAAREVDLTAADKQAIAEQLERLQKLADLYCTGCNYCQPCEAANVNIPAVLGNYNLGNVYDLWGPARQRYADIGKWDGGKTDAAACTDCGDCEEKCPQNIPIRDQLKKSHAKLAQES